MHEPRLETKENQDPFEVERRNKLAKELNAKYISSFGDGSLAMVILEEDPDKKYLFNRSGEKIAGPFFHFRPFKEGLARVRKDAGYYFIDTEGKEIIGPLDKSWYIGDFEGGLVSVSVGPKEIFNK